MARPSSLFTFTHGDHTCLFYSGMQSLLDVLTPYIADGLRNGERCFCAQPAETLQALSHELRFLGIDTEREMRRGSLELHTVNEVYFRDRRFEPEILMELLELSIDKSLRDGYSGFRTAGELSWAVEGRNDCDRLIGYEKKVQESYPQRPAVGLCQYPVHKFTPEVLASVVEAHSKVLDNCNTQSQHASLRVRNTRCDVEIVTDKAGSNNYQYVVQFQDGERLWGETRGFDVALKTVEGLTKLDLCAPPAGDRLSI